MSSQEPEITSQQLGERIRELREARGMSAIQLSDRAQLAQSYVPIIEAGHQRIPPRAILLRIARALGVPERRLLEPPSQGGRPRGRTPERGSPRPR